MPEIFDDSSKQPVPVQDIYNAYEVARLLGRRIRALRHQGGVRAGAERTYRRDRRRMGKGRDDNEELRARPSREEDVLHT